MEVEVAETEIMESPPDNRPAFLLTDFPGKCKLCVICALKIPEIGGVIDEEGNYDLEGELKGESNIKPEVFLKGLSVICEKLSLDVTFGTGEFWRIAGMNNFVGAVCCVECYKVLEELVQMYELILSKQNSLTESIQTIERNVVESTKRSEDAEFSVNPCYMFRESLLKNFQQRNRKPSPSTEHKRKFPKPGPLSSSSRKKRAIKTSCENQYDLRPCLVKLERIDESEPLINGISQLRDDQTLPVVVDNFVEFGDDYSEDVDESISLSSSVFSGVNYSQVQTEIENENITERKDDDEDFNPQAGRQRGRGRRKKRGRPKKKLTKEELIKSLIKRPRGRPPKPKVFDEFAIKRPRGRPKNATLLNTNSENESQTISDTEVSCSSSYLKIENSQDFDNDRQPNTRSRSSTSVPATVPQKRRAGRPPKNPMRPVITLAQAKLLANEGPYKKAILIVNAENYVYSFCDVRLHKEGTALVCKYPGCEFTIGDMAYFADQVTFRCMKMHVRHDHRVKYKCKTLDTTTNDNPNDNKRIYCCCYCDDQLNDKGSLWDHMRSHHSDAKPLQMLCETCGTTIDQHSFSKHLYSHKNKEEKEIAKATRNKRCGNKRDLSIPLHAACDQCDKVFKNNTLLRIHKISHVPIEVRKTFQCDICGHKMASAATLNLHKQRVHFKTGINYPYECNICNRKYNNRQRIKYIEHMYMHTGERPHSCSICGKGFRGRYSLKKHENLHLDTKIQCAFCPNSYKNRIYLRRHQLRAHPELVEVRKPVSEITKKNQNPEHSPDFIGPKMAHPCEPCGRVYLFKSQLVSHMKHKHKVFLSKNEDYPEQNTIEMQQMSEAGEDPYSKLSNPQNVLSQICDLCGKGYIFKSQLVAHMRSRHKVTMPRSQDSADYRHHNSVRLREDIAQEQQQNQALSTAIKFEG